MSAPRRTLSLLLGLAVCALAIMFSPAAAHAAVPTSGTTSTPGSTSPAETGRPSGGAATAPTAPTAPNPPGATGGSKVTVDITSPDGAGAKPSSSITIILAVTLLSVAPALLLLMTSFTKIFVVLGLTRNALGLQATPPNQVLAGLALFLTLFVMTPVLTQVNKDGVQPYLKGQLSQTPAFNAGVKPLKTFMAKHTRTEELALITQAAGLPKPKNAASVPLSTLVPAFVLSELRSAFVIGFLVFVPFLVIDLVVSAALMSLGMMMLPPVTVSLPFKLLLFVLVDGWGLIVQALVASYR